MGNCKYSYKGLDSNYLYCNISHSICPLVRYCSDVDSVISIDNYNISCKYYKNEEEKFLQKEGNNKVRFIKSGLLYTELNDQINQIVKVENPYDYEPKYIDLIKVNNNYYVKGFEPQEPKIEQELIIAPKNNNKRPRRKSK